MALSTFVAFSITKNEEDALDILQDAYLQAWKNLSSIENPALFDPWFRRVTGNEAKKFVKKRRPQLFTPLDSEDDFLEDLPDGDGDYAPSSAMDTEETHRLIMEIVDELPEDQRLCVLMRYYNDMDTAEIAAALDIPYETIKSRLRYGKKKISEGVKALEKHGTKLYGAAPIPLLAWLLHNLAGQDNSRLPYTILGGSAAAAGGAAAAGTAAAGGAAAAGGTAIAGGTAAAGGIVAGITLPQILAGVAAVVVLGGGAATGAALVQRAQDPPMIEPAGIVEYMDYDNAAEDITLAMPELPFLAPTDVANEEHTYVYGFSGTTSADVVSTAYITTGPPHSAAQTTGGTTTTKAAGTTSAATTTAPPPTTSRPPTTPAPPVTYTITYNHAQNGGSSSSIANAAVQGGGTANLSATATKPGWEFVGWNTNRDAHTGLSSYAVNGNTTLYAIFRKQVTATFATFADSFCNVLSYETRSAWRYNNQNAAIASPGAESIEVFSTERAAGWGLPGDAANGRIRYAPGAAIPLAADETFYAIYSWEDSYSFRPNPFFSGSEIIRPCTGIFDAYDVVNGWSMLPVTIPHPPDNPGFTFVCWRPNGSVVDYLPGETLVQGPKLTGGVDWTFHAVWEPIP